MTTSASPTADVATAALPPHPVALAGQIGNVPLTHVSLTYLEHRLKLYLRFDEPTRMLPLDRWRRCAVFLPNAVLCRTRWQANDYGTVRWQFMVMQTAAPLDTVRHIPGVQPGARLLLHTEGGADVRTVLERIDGTGALGITPIDVSPVCQCTLDSRLVARLTLLEYTAGRHTASPVGKVLP